MCSNSIRDDLPNGFELFFLSIFTGVSCEYFLYPPEGL